ncbi:ATP-binding protein [Thiomicrorhabdus sediminis]|uniref:histidine kinase n=1 Tax=Thiomicrorhabdus sediminis TaxID=2580412 RepID=A0A4P9K4J9_9GAMM|nr:ATP-binding protein [Thiomicrorhabdus sediminis]QCU89875.1 response regulator [Thiomicrorhabdus sediminis]
MIPSLKQYQFLPLALAIVLLLIAAIFSIQSERKFNEVEKSWLSYAERSNQLDRLMIDIQGAMGYGGFIHNFKNLVIRQDLDTYGAKIEQNYTNLENSLRLLQYELKVDTDILHLSNIHATIEEYYSQYQTVKRLINKNRTSEQIDKLVKVDDTFALESFNFLKNRINERLVEIKLAVEKEYSEAQQFLWFSRLVILISFFLAVAILYRYHTKFAFLTTEAVKVKEVIDSINVGLWEIDLKDQSKTNWNDTCSQILETPQDMQMDTDRFISFFKYGENAKTIDTAIRNAISKGESFSEELEIITFKENKLWVRVEGIALYEAGQLTKVFGLIENISDKKALEKELVEMRDQALEASRSKSEFLANMSHELRTPLNAIIGFSQLLERDPETSPQHKEDIQTIHNAGKHLLTIINDILDLSAIDAGKLSISIKPVKLSSAVDSSIAFLKTLASKKNIQIECHNLDGVYVRADLSRLKQVLINLLSNAIKYNHDNGTVVFRADIKAEHIRLNVIDNGMGIDKNQIPLLFKPFDRLGRENLAIQGTGIGLSLSKKLISIMGGEIGVTSTLNQGSCFWIELPLEKTLDYQPEHTQSNAHNDYKIGLEKTVLYIEDNPSNISLMKSFIEKETKLQLLTAQRPELGIQLALTHKPDLVLLDINLPGMDGYEVLKQLKKDDITKDITVFAVTANAMPNDITKGKASGFSEYITKPIDFDVLAELIKKIV